MKKPYTEPKVQITLFEQVIATGRPPINQSGGGHNTNFFDEEEEEA